MPAVVAVEACLLDMVQDGLPTNGTPNNNNPTTTTSRITEVLRRHRTALQCTTNNIRETHSTTMRDITDSKAVSSFNPQRILMLAVVAIQSMRHHLGLQVKEDMVVMDSSDDLKATKESKEQKNVIENCTMMDVKLEWTDSPLAFSI